ncbi:DUF4126 domain-containing protein [Ornithinimicrobium ciconiae]|uniref:DUF4126 domain-containing protein n=1 Tax=Ornithinimicrobium ciconiae TaxID=2594265 RepID=A0A516GE28_9MICO|nr:DUF4126 domain-containing protein [Ornithinimicrobium ciconiae]QDO89787.1 DUF4126 domain-containing protein [Ornithinimicrobium ciconiae]
MLAALTGAGLSAAAGLNAYIPFLIVALMARFSDVITLPEQFAWIESEWAIGGAAVLLLGEVVFDKIPVVDHINDAVGTFIRPASGGLIFAATQAAEDFEQGSSFMADNPWIGVVLGIVTAGLVHTGKAVTRPVVNASTMGIGAPLVSTAEDTASVGLSIVAIFFPIIVFVLLILMLWGGIVLWRKARQRTREREAAVTAYYG